MSGKHLLTAGPPTLSVPSPLPPTSPRTSFLQPPAPACTSVRGGPVTCASQPRATDTEKTQVTWGSALEPNTTASEDPPGGTGGLRPPNAPPSRGTAANSRSRRAASRDAAAPSLRHVEQVTTRGQHRPFQADSRSGTPEGRLGRPRSRPGRPTRARKIRSNHEELQKPGEGGGRPQRGPAPRRPSGRRGPRALLPARGAATSRGNKDGPAGGCRPARRTAPATGHSLGLGSGGTTGHRSSPPHPLLTPSPGTLVSTFTEGGGAAGEGGQTRS